MASQDKEENKEIEEVTVCEHRVVPRIGRLSAATRSAHTPWTTA